jgi:ribonucleotide monophosphatase NagD (HAD superfamily)
VLPPRMNSKIPLRFLTNGSAYSARTRSATGASTHAIDSESPFGCPSATEAQGLLADAANVRIVCAAA